METIIELIKEFLVPGSIPFLLLGLVMGIVLLFRRGAAAKWGRRWLTLLVIGYWVLSTPLVALALEAALSHGYNPIKSTDTLDSVEALVILGGGSDTYRAGDQEVNALSEASVLRALEGSRLYAEMEVPWVIASGGINERAGMLTPESEPMRDQLERSGVPVDSILLESASSNTYEQALNLRPILETHGIDHFVLVTSPTHMRRSLATFKAQGLRPTPSTSAQHPEGFLDAYFPLLPNEDALQASRNAMREIMALVFYQLSGRFSPP
jgi:uncharacterized SAM-binding protein YcdF (DUF218 family)